MKKRFAIKYDFPWKDIDGSGIQTKDYERHQLSFTIDQHKILDLLVGETLYNNITVSLRELAQNAIDAVKVKKYECSNNYNPQVVVSWYPETRQLIVADNGTGMDKIVIQNHLLKVGSSRYADENFKKEHPNFYSISKFGIGLLSCFLVADDVDILTKIESEEKPLLLKVSKLHGKYLLKHGKEENSRLSLLDETRSGTSIMLKIKNEICDFNPEHILREWILFPDCSFSYFEDEKNIKIGYDNTKSLIEDVMLSNGLSVDNSQYNIVNKYDEDIDISILLRHNKYLKEWSFVECSEIERRENKIVLSAGISVKGIRIDNNTPGFRLPNFIAVANLTGRNAPYPNVARTAINTYSLSRVLEKFYDIYLQEINRQITDIAKQYSITWALEELPYLLEPFYGRDADTLIDKEVFNKSLEKQKFFLVYSQEHKLLSVEELKNLGHFWIIDSVAYNSALSLIREAKTPEQSAIKLLNSLYGENCSLFNDVDVVLDNGLSFGDLSKSILDNFEITDIYVFEDFRTLNLKWAKKNEASQKWLKIADTNYDEFSRRTSFFYGYGHSYFVQNGSVNMNFKGSYESIRCAYGLFILEGSPIHEPLKEIINNNSIKSDLIIAVCVFIEALFDNNHNKENDENLEYLFEEYITRKFSHNLFQRLKSEICIDKLLKACKESSFSMYDKRLWYRWK